MRRMKYRHLLSASTLAADLEAYERLVSARPERPLCPSLPCEVSLPAGALEAARDARRAPREAFVGDANGLWRSKL